MSGVCCSYARSRPNESRLIHPLVAEGETGRGRERHRAAGGARGGRGAGGGTRAVRTARAEDAGQPVPAREATVLLIAELTLHEASGRGGAGGSHTSTAGGGNASTAAGSSGDPRRELGRETRREARRATGAGGRRRQEATTLLRSRKSKSAADEAEGGDERELHLEKGL